MIGLPLTLGTAGHVDHGKTALVRALTGHETDRLPEEKARGLTIEPGFAPMDLPSGRRLSLVDVPGHERFVRHMVAGASGIDGFLLCVAADDGVMPQTREHLDILRLLGVTSGVVALTRRDRADPAEAARAVCELLGPAVPVVAVCAPRGEGIAELSGALDALAGRLSRRTAAGPARLFIDRSFSVVGAGTVVTGTLWGDPMHGGDRVRVLPGGARARIRTIEAHGRPLERAEGGRIALALAGVERSEAPRGACVVADDVAWEPTDHIELDLRWLPAGGAPLQGRRRLRALVGTAEVAALCVPREREPVPPGGAAVVRLRLDRPLPLRTGDPVVLRSAERGTVGGGRVRDAHPAPRARHRRIAAPPPPRAPVPDALVEVLVTRLREAGLSPPAPAELAREAGIDAGECGRALAEARARGLVVEGAGIWFASAPALAAREGAVEALEGGPLTIGALRDLWGVGRRHALALATHLDAAGVTRREGDVRVLRRGARRV